MIKLLNYIKTLKKSLYESIMWKSLDLINSISVFYLILFKV